MMRLAIMPIGRSRCGLRVSSAVVETASNPIKAKKTIAAPLITPPKPLGKNGVQFGGLIRHAPKAMKKTTTATLMMTIQELVLALSRMPKISSTVTDATMKNEGRMSADGSPKKVGNVDDE